LNGSLQTTIKSPGFDVIERAKGLLPGPLQVQMTQTFNMNILNSSFNILKNK
jgi:hypothetical protein